MMPWKKGLLPALFLVATAPTGAIAEEVVRHGQEKSGSQGVVFATPLLSETEQADYRARIRTAADASERERIRAAHYELMRTRARERGQTLPERRPDPTGEAGKAFGPQLTTEEDRAARRGKIRRAGNEPSGGASTKGPVLSDRQIQAVEIGRRRDEVTSGSGVNEAPPTSSSTASHAPAMGVVALPGIDRLFGPQLMTEEEKAAFRARLRAAKSDADRQAIRAERDQLFQLRAKENGMASPH
ncbi:MAG: hypothetical protein WC681_03350 [Sterolibacterium sp.]|jgi:hypothetical protein